MKITAARSGFRRGLSIAFLVLVTVLGASRGQTEQQAPPPSGASLDRDAIVNHLNAVISWYRDSTTKLQTAGEPSDVIYQDNAQNLAAEALRLAFESAKQEAAVLSAEEKGAAGAENGQPANTPGQPNYSQVEARVSTQIAGMQTQLDAVNRRLESAPRATRDSLTTQRDVLQGQIDLYKSMQEAVQKMASFAGAEATSEGLLGTINTLARSVPEVLENTKPGSVSKPPVPQQPRPATSAGLIGQSAALYAELTDMRALDALLNETSRVRDAADAVRKPIRDSLVATIRTGNAVINQNPSGENQAGPSQPPQNQTGTAAAGSSAPVIQKEYRDLTAKFKAYSDAMVPLAQEMAVLDQSRSNFEEWRRSMARESRANLQTLVTRVIGIVFALAVVLLLSELWRRLTFRYIHDARRRRQFLVLRRFVIGFLLGIVIILGFVSEFSSLATFAGFVTAGIAVGLQTVLLSVAAYFFVIGRYGIRVGDRISISGVTGDVIEIGLVRLYLMELAGSAVDLYPTGRIVVFSNSVLFQATTPLFKQLPGTDYTWHEVVLDLAPGGNHKLAQEKTSAAVNSVYEQYRPDIERRSSTVGGRVEFQLKSPNPEAKLQFADSGLELLVRYPVELRKESEVDDHVTRILLDLISSDPEMKAAVRGSPRIRAVVKV